MSTVAVVDDNSDNRLIIRTILEDQYEIEEFATGTEAIQAFRQGRPDVVILDISLPEMPGSKIFDELRLIKPNANIILSTAHSLETVTLEFGAREIQGFIRKPYQVDELEQVLARIFRPKLLKARAAT